MAQYNSRKAEVLPAKADNEELVAGGEQLYRLENTTQLMIAISRPRDEAKILASALAELELYPSQAEEAIYCKPVGKDKNGVMKFARDLSIRAAESLALRWSNSAWEWGVVGEDEMTATICAVWLDYEQNVRHQVTRRVSKMFKKSSGQMQRIADDRFHDLNCPRVGSLLLRGVILRSLPAGLRTEYRIRAERLIPPMSEAGKARMLALLAEEGVSKETVQSMISTPWEKLTEADYLDLKGYYNALKGKEVTANGQATAELPIGAPPGTRTPDVDQVKGIGDAPDRPAASSKADESDVKLPWDRVPEDKPPEDKPMMPDVAEAPVALGVFVGRAANRWRARYWDGNAWKYREATPDEITMVDHLARQDAPTTPQDAHSARSGAPGDAAGAEQPQDGPNGSERSNGAPVVTAAQYREVLKQEIAGLIAEVGDIALAAILTEFGITPTGWTRCGTGTLESIKKALVAKAQN